MANQLFAELTNIPYVSKFVVFAHRHNLTKARLRAFCITDDPLDKTLERQQNYVEVARSRSIEVRDAWVRPDEVRWEKVGGPYYSSTEVRRTYWRDQVGECGQDLFQFKLR